MFKTRYLVNNIIEDLSEKMVFIGGPRQVGKTTLSCELVGKNFNEFAYFNWDNRGDRRNIINSNWPGNVELLIFDEIHKYKKWKSFVKGEYDKLKNKYKFIVTGSARLDLYRKGGDSLQGRYHYYRLHPFSLAEILNKKNNIKIFREIKIDDSDHFLDLKSLNIFGGFPEPFIKQNSRSLKRWQNEKIERLFREDIRDVNLIKDIGNMKLLSDFLPTKVGSLLSLNSLREDIEVSHRAITSWLNILESFYYCFRIHPYSKNNFRSLKKEPKLYLWDGAEITDPGARFENIIASHLLKLVHYLYDYEGEKAELHFIRDINKKEVDFLVTIEKKPWFAVEVKSNNISISKPLVYFREKLNIPFVYQIVNKANVDRFVDNIRIISADKFLAGLI